MANQNLSEKNLEAVSGGVSSGRDWIEVGAYILENCQNDPQYDQLKPDLSELQGFCSPPGFPLNIQSWVYDHYSFSVVQNAMRL